MKASEFRFEWYSGTGAGGQKRNKCQNCCRCIHVPTGIRANGTENRSREANKRNALAVCIARIDEHFAVQEERFKAGKERIRTYHAVSNRVTDHRSGETDTYKNVIFSNGIGHLIKARKLAISAC